MENYIIILNFDFFLEWYTLEHNSLWKHSHTLLRRIKKRFTRPIEKKFTKHSYKWDFLEGWISSVDDIYLLRPIEKRFTRPNREEIYKTVYKLILGFLVMMN